MEMMTGKGAQILSYEFNNVSDEVLSKICWENRLEG